MENTLQLNWGIYLSLLVHMQKLMHDDLQELLITKVEHSQSKLHLVLTRARRLGQICTQQQIISFARQHSVTGRVLDF